MVHVLSSIEDLVGSADVPLAALELPSGKVLFANAAAARVLGVTPETFIGSNYLDLVAPEGRQRAEEAWQALASGALTGYQTVGILGAEGAAQELALWVCAVEVEGARAGLVSAVPLHGGGRPLEPATAALSRTSPQL